MVGGWWGGPKLRLSWAVTTTRVEVELGCDNLTSHCIGVIEFLYLTFEEKTTFQKTLHIKGL